MVVPLKQKTLPDGQGGVRFVTSVQDRPYPSFPGVIMIAAAVRAVSMTRIIAGQG
jgi:hypothetical protein